MTENEAPEQNPAANDEELADEELEQVSGGKLIEIIDDPSDPIDPGLPGPGLGF